MVSEVQLHLLKHRLTLILLAALFLVACQRQNEVQLTLIAQNATLEAEMEGVRQTATVDAERLQITVVFMNTLVGQAEQNRVQMQATLLTRGTPAAGIENVQPSLSTPFPTPGGSGAVNPPPTVVVTPDTTQQVAPTDMPSEPALINATMAPGVGNDDCAVGATSNFSISTPEIYIVATGQSIPAGTNIAARFSIAGQEILHDFTPDFEIDGACVWFFIDQTDLEFRAGTWSVQLELNGAPATQPIPFTITGEDAMAEDAG